MKRSIPPDLASLFQGLWNFFIGFTFCFSSVFEPVVLYKSCMAPCESHEMFWRCSGFGYKQKPALKFWDRTYLPQKLRYIDSKGWGIFQPVIRWGLQGFFRSVTNATLWAGGKFILNPNRPMTLGIQEELGETLTSTGPTQIIGRCHTTSFQKVS